ncbi:hypothetical protein F5Y16DRAFT_69293 [Xylariaceae sp. FL0255]|nr:hypothetical protein F5Y16DRAFT_69293 [Xylariaceae sp. FL0255]
MTTRLAAESSTWYSITLVVLFCRFMSRKLLSGTSRKFHIDDLLIIIALFTDTVLMVAINILSYTNTNLFDPADPPTLTPQDIKQRVFGSKLVLIVEQMQIATIWLVKGCLLIMYSRLTSSPKQRLAVKIVAGYVVFGWVVMEILWFFVWCRPFYEYIAVPTDNIQCSAALHHLIVNAVFNISSDVCIIAIPLPLLARSSLPLRKKFMLGSIFALGLFTIGAAISSKVYSFDHPFAPDWAYWYIRESSTALVVANLPYFWVMTRFTFNLHSFHSVTEIDECTPDLNKGLRVEYGHNSHGVEHKTTISRGSFGPDDFANPSESQEYINNFPLKIYKRQEVHITHEIEGEGTGSSSGDDGPLGLSPRSVSGRPSTHRASQERTMSFSI